MVLRLNVRLQTVELELAKDMPEDQADPVTHQALSGTPRECIVTEERAAKGAANNVADVNDSHQILCRFMHDEEGAMFVR